MELSELTNRELKNILRQNQVKNYSKLNKKELVKKVNQLIKAQNGGKSGEKKYTLKDLIGGDPAELTKSLLSNKNREEKNKDATIYTRESRGNQPPSLVKYKNKSNTANSQNNPIQSITANSQNNPIQSITANSQNNPIQTNQANSQNSCGACTIQ